MPHSFTHYWRNQSVDNIVDDKAKEILEHAADDHFAQRGVSVGDQVYSGTMFNSQLFMIAKMVVGHLVHDQAEAAELLGCEPDELWQAADQLITARATTMAIRRISLEDTEQLRFGGSGERKPLFFKAPGRSSEVSVQVLTLESTSMRLLQLCKA